MIRWRLFGIQFCIEPSFWFMNALWAMFVGGALTGHQLHDRLLIVFILVWILCMFVSVMVHELGHVILARIFGEPGSITLSGMGGRPSARSTPCGPGSASWLSWRDRSPDLRSSP